MLLGCATGPGDGDYRETLQPVQKVATGCFAVQSPGTPVAMDFMHPSAGTSGLEVSSRIAGRFVIDNAWLPWWSARPSSVEPLGAMAIEITPANEAADASAWLEVGADVRLTDASGLVIVAQRTTFHVPSRDEAFATIDFEDAALARRLGLPAAEQPSKSADPFQLHLSWTRGKLQAYLGSLRAGNTCSLWQPKPEPSLCEPGAGALVMDEDAVTEPRGLRDTLSGTFAPIEAIEAMQQQGPLEVRWPEGTASRLYVAYEPVGHACVTEGEIPVQATEFDVTNTLGYKVVIPVQATLRSEDGRLLVRMTGAVETRIAHDQPWDGFAEAALGYHERAQLAPAERIGFEVPAGSLGFLFGWLRVPMTDSHSPQLSFTRCEPYPGVPAFPPLTESASNRLNCFCAKQDYSEAHIRLSTP